MEWLIEWKIFECRATYSIGGSVSIGKFGLGADVLFRKDSYIPKGIRIYTGKSIIFNPFLYEGHVTIIEIGSPKNIKSDKRAYNGLINLPKNQGKEEESGRWIMSR